MTKLNPLSNVLWTINITLAVLWIYQGIVPKLIYHATDEQRLWELNGFDEIIMLFMIQIAGYAEIIFGVLFLIFKQSKILHVLNILAMCGLGLLIVVTDIQYFQHAFNPFVMNVAMAMLSVVALQLLKIENKSKNLHS